MHGAHGALAMYASAFVLAVTSAALGSNAVRISQVYGGGGTSAPYNADFVELYNSGATAADIGGYTLTYASATGTYGAGQFSFPAGTKIGANSYVLVQMNAAAAGGTGAALKADYYTATAIEMSATAGNVALLTAAQSGTTNTCASLTATLVDKVGYGTTAVDKVGYGTTANCFEGTSFAPSPSATTAVIRKANGATDTDINSADFYAATPMPRNSLTRASWLAQPASTPSGDGWTEVVTGTASGSVGSSDISTVSWALTATAGSANGITETRTVSAGAGKTISLDFDGNAAAAPATGCSTGIEFRSGANVALSLKLENGTSFWKVVDGSGTTTSTLAPTTGAIAISLAIRGSGAYVLTANAYSRSGTLASSSTVIDSVRVFNTGIATAVNFNNLAVADSIVSITAAPGVTAIPDNNATGTSASIVVSAAQAPTTTKVRDIRASMTVSHTFAGDLSLSVVAPDGTVGYLVNRIVSVNDNSNYSGTYLFADPYQGNLFSVATAAADVNIATGSYYPTNNSAGTASDLTGVFFNKTVNGTWKLTAADGGAQDTGTFTTGTLEIWLGTDTDGDGTLDEFDGCPGNASFTTPATWYQDSDGDTYGNYAVSQASCSQPTGYVSNSTDCNDSNAAIKPGAPELCANSTVDDNCNGNSTEIDAAASDKVNFYVDADGDTYTTAVSATFCPATTNAGYRSYLSSPVDCNDTSSAVNPGAAEICDGVDNNCSGATDEGFTDSDGDGLANCVDLGYSAALTGGNIPDNSANGLVMTFTVPSSGFFTAGISNARVTLTGLTHGVVGDLTCTLTSPDGTVANIFVRPGGAGDTNDFSGTYVFDDSYTANLHTTATGSTTNTALAAGNYFASNSGGGKVTLNTVFGAKKGGGTWTLKIFDSAANNTGALTSARVELTAVPDADGDGTSDALDGCDQNALLTAPVTYYLDADSDGYGTSGTTQSLCQTSAPAGYVTVSGDCNDSNSAIKPGATEICDGIDENCDGVLDNGFPDSDGDGIGDCVDTNFTASFATSAAIPDAGAAVNSTAMTIGTEYSIYTIGTTTTAQWNSAGVVGTPVNGTTFVATKTTTGGGTGTVSAVGKLLKTFVVPAGQFTAGISNVRVTLNMTHTWTGDITATLTAPNGTSIATILRRPGLTSTVNGYGSDFAGGNYVFDDAYTSNFWTAANITGVVPVGNYFPSGLAGVRTALTSPFAALTSGTAAGTWTLKITDSINVDTGTLNSASVDITEVPDADGDGTSDALDGCPNNASLTSPRTYYVDADGDGYGTSATTTSCTLTAPAGASSLTGDCNDSNSAIKPGAAELCADATVDNNCNGNATEVDVAAADKVTFYTDADGDTYTLATGAKFCSGTTNTGYRAAVSSPVDCDDTKAAVYPGAAELCADATVDNNCNGNATEVDAGAVDKVTFYTDADGDTYTLATGAKFCSGTT
ncbi:MAG: MopE-related protein, partial [Planctomycetota bacterium]|nr:MopE-related protein [Planctomycetota bacterium]